MATATLFPDSTVSNTDWSVTGDTVHERLASDPALANPPNSGIVCDADGAVCVVTFGDFDFSALNVQSITSVQVQTTFYMETKGVTNSIEFVLEEADGTDIQTTDTGPITANDVYQTLNGSALTQVDSGDWDDKLE